MKTLPIVLFVMAMAAAADAQPALPTCKPKPATPATAPAEAKPQTYQDLWCDRVLEIDALRRRVSGTGPQAGVRDEIDNVISVHDRGWPAFLLYAQARSGSVDAAAVEEARTDKQIGAPAGAGSTSLVSKGAVPGILGFAVENGALTQSTSGTTVTLRGNLVGWLDLLKDKDFIASYQDGSSVVRGLRRVSYSLTLNTDTGETTAVAMPSGPALTPQAIRDQLEKTKQQLAGYSVRVAIVDKRDPRTAANRALIATLADTKLVEVLKADNAFDSFLSSAEYTRKWVPETVDLLSDPTRTLNVADIQRILYQRLEGLRLLMISRIDGFDDAVARNLLALRAYDKARLRLFEAIRKQPLFAVEYVATRSKDLPDNSTVRFIAEYQWGSRLDLTANAAMTFQRSSIESSAQPTALESGRRDFQLAGQMDMPLGSLEKRLGAGSGVGPPVLAVAFLSQKLTERAAVTFAGNALTVEPGWIHAVQAKVTVPVKGSGVKIPLSLSYSNRTELIKEKDVRGHIGVTFDMDVLSSAVRR
jgi:hypothetical protein